MANTTSLNIYANEQILVIDWNYGQAIPEGILLTLNDKGLPKPIQGVFLTEKGRYLMMTLVPDLPELSKVKFEIRGRDAGLIDSFISKGKLKPFLEKNLQNYSQESVTKILRAFVRKAPLAFKEIKTQLLRDLCKQLGIEVLGWKAGEEIYFNIPCALTDNQKAEKKEILIWRLVDGMADSYEKLTAFWQDNRLHVFVPTSFIADGDAQDGAVYVVEDADSFAIPFKLGKAKKLPKGLNLEETLATQGMFSSQLKSFLNRTVKKK